MNEIEKVIKERRSIRKFKSTMPNKEDIEKIIANLYRKWSAETEKTGT